MGAGAETPGQNRGLVLRSSELGRDSCGRRRRRLPSFSFDATALRAEPGLRSTPSGEPWRGTASDRATVPARVGRVSDRCHGAPHWSRWHLQLLAIWPHSGNTGTRSLLGAARLIAADDAGRRAVGKPTILRSGTRDPQYCLAGCLPEPSKPCAHVGEAVPSLRRSPLLTVHHPAPASETMTAAVAISTPP